MPNPGLPGPARSPVKGSPQGFQGVQCWYLLPALPATRETICAALCIAVVVRGELRWEGFDFLSSDYELAAISALVDRLAGLPASPRFHWHRDDKPMALDALARYGRSELVEFFPYTLRDICHG